MLQCLGRNHPGLHVPSKKETHPCASSQPTLPVALLLCAPALPALAATLTVQPGQSIQSAVNAANPGDTIVVKGGTYGEQVLIATNANGVPLNGLSLVGTNGATLNGPGLEATNGITIGASNVTVRASRLSSITSASSSAVPITSNNAVLVTQLAHLQ